MIKAVLFDMDGVLVDSEEITYQAAVQMFKLRGVTVCKEDFAPYIGAGDVAYLGGAAEAHGLKYDRQMSVVTYEIYDKLAEKHNIAYENTYKTVAALKDMGVMRAVCTSADKVKMEINLRVTGLSSMFDALINGRDIKRNKPAPDIYLKGAEVLGVEPGQCLVIEDAKNGILAAKAAMMHQCAVTTTFTEEELKSTVRPEFIVSDIYKIAELIRNYNTKGE